MSLFINYSDGYYSLTKAGSVFLFVIIAVLIVLTALVNIVQKDDETPSDGKARIFSTKQLVFSAAAVALGFITSYIKLLHMPWGGSVTLCSMLFVVLSGYWYGPKIGICAGFAYGLLQFVQTGSSYFLSPLQACMDYIFAFAALGLSGFFYKKKNGLIKGYIFAILIRGLFHTIGAYLYWMDYMPDNFPKSLAPVYPIVYNYSYILIEGAVTIIILLLPPVKDVMSRVKRMALE